MDDIKKITGIFPAIVTPFTSQGELDKKVFEQLVGLLYDSGVHGLFVGGNMGEWYTQTVEERKELASRAVLLSKNKGRVIVHVGSTRMEDAIVLARYAEKTGADAIATLPPYHARLTEKDVAYYYTRLAQSVSLPVFLYHHPQLTGYQMGAVTMDAIQSSPNIAGIKYTDYDLLNLANLIDFSKNRLCIMNGHDQVLLPGLTTGASGGIGSFYNVIPRAFVALYDHVEKGEKEAAHQLQSGINEFIQIVKKHALVPALKYILQLNDIGTGNFRVSIVPLSDAEGKKLGTELDGSAFYKKWKIGTTSSL
jgi:N-acetylneuraminate lyase